LDHAIYTIGYGNREADELLMILHRLEIRYLVDVRSVPFSRHEPAYSRASLEKRLRQCGIRYLYMGDSLGGRPNDRSCYTSGKVDYAKLAEKEFYQAGVERLIEAWRQRLSVCLLCSERQPEKCHRSKLLGVSLATVNVPVLHVAVDGGLQAQADVMRLVSSDQLGLFGTLLTSRKRYMK
jgi:uncharacterized protein (DUF488 family)